MGSKIRRGKEGCAGNKVNKCREYVADDSVIGNGGEGREGLDEFKSQEWEGGDPWVVRAFDWSQVVTNGHIGSQMPLSRTRSLLSNINGGGHGGHGGAVSGASSNSSATTPNDGLDSTATSNLTGRGQFGRTQTTVFLYFTSGI